ncbi:Elongator subunit elp2 [Exophiala xenobiotica]|uniref:Elongator complex protein 2 n=1 Tax=Lithohypha guttulata TaxID=1690604 RepID=A0ABR0KLT5_9EURO|nr:Elongator subunit elp2 [Lithohypha guttulata]KAK5312738.1 Elongator subunit elp2 [Exophiala xenobiotica]
MSLAIVQEYLSIGGNTHSAASAWCAALQCFACGADRNVALWRPLNDESQGVHQILHGHGEKVTAIAFGKSVAQVKLISGAANGEVIVWSLCEGDTSHELESKTQVHKGAVNVITASNDFPYLVTGGSDATVRVWKLDGSSMCLIADIKPKPRFIPLALAVGTLPSTLVEEGFFVVAAGTRNDLQVYSIQGNTATLSCSLTGHEGWVRSLALRKSESGYLLASTSADKYTRLWKFSSGDIKPQTNGHVDKDIPGFEQALTAKVKSVGTDSKKYSITFEALLLGHEDWVYSADWQEGDEERLLTSSADGTLAIWEPDPTSGIWVSETRLGEISGQKGATTATGSAGGFWTGKWIGNSTVVSLGRTASWRIWQYDKQNYFWDLKHGIGGHADSVNGLCWSPMGEYLLSTSSDQTTRLHAEWRRNGKRTWHEFSRCQIHGYNCNVVSCISSHQFASGAEEKLLRVFNEPKELAETLYQLCEIEPPNDATLPETAAIPVLGLSNKEMGEPDDIIEAGPRKGDEDYAAANAMAGLSLRGIVEPPTEDLLSRHTLWPEHEKLYGHGYEISESAYKDGILATASKASSLDHATIRLYDTNNWRQIEPPLAAHSLTVTRLAWSQYPENYLLSVGRDRQWTVFAREGKRLKLYQSMPKAHTRMILDAAWSPVGGYPFFATAGRDKTVKLWGHALRYAETASDEFCLTTSLARPSAVTAIDMTCDEEEVYAILVVGEEDGRLSIHSFDLETLKLKKSIELDSLSKAVNRVAWRAAWPTWAKDGPGAQLAIAGADGSVRVLRVDVASMC